MVSPGNQYCANCIGTLSLAIALRESVSNIAYLVADSGHGAADVRNAKHRHRRNEADDLNHRHPVREERPRQTTNDDSYTERYNQSGFK